MLVNKTYRTSEYRMFEVHEKGKTRIVADLPFFPDRIVHWALIMVLHDMIMKNLIHQTYAALPRRGAHQALSEVREALKDPDARYFLKLDIRQYFPSIDKEVMYRKLERRVKDRDVLDLCKLIIDEYPNRGLPIGNYTSQYFANFYLSELDHYMKEQYHCKWYFRYMDDIVIIGWSKPWLRRALKRIRDIVGPWGLEIKGNWCIRPTTEGIDYVGYVATRTEDGHVYVKLRKRTKMRMKRACKDIRTRWGAGEEPTAHDRGVLASYNGCLQWCDGYYLGMKTIYPLMDILSTKENDYNGEDEISQQHPPAREDHRTHRGHHVPQRAGLRRGAGGEDGDRLRVRLLPLRPCGIRQPEAERHAPRRSGVGRGAPLHRALGDVRQGRRPDSEGQRLHRLRHRGGGLRLGGVPRQPEGLEDGRESHADGPGLPGEGGVPAHADTPPAKPLTPSRGGILL